MNDKIANVSSFRALEFGLKRSAYQDVAKSHMTDVRNFEERKDDGFSTPDIKDRIRRRSFH